MIRTRSGRSRVLALVVVAACGGSRDATPDAPDAAPDAALDPCRPAGPPRAVGNVRGVSAELSGLAASRVVDGVLWTHADSGGTATIFAIDDTAASRGQLRLTGVTAIDWEDIATGPCPSGQCIFVSDTGDNALARASVAIYEVTEPTAIGSVDVASTRFDITYPDGPHDVEALVVDPRDGALYGITKLQGVATLYGFPRGGQATALGQLPMLSGADVRVTGADLFVDDACGARLLVRARSGLFAFVAPRETTMAALIATTPTAWPVANEPQGEAIAWRRDGRAYFTVSEGTDPPLYVAEP